MTPEMPGLTPNAMALLWALVECWAGHPVRAASIIPSANEKTTRRACKRLEFWGLVRLHQRGRGQGPAHGPARGVWVEPTFLGRRVIERAANQPVSAIAAAK